MKKYLSTILLVLIFIFAFSVMLYSAKKDSITTDEGVHLAAGYTYLTQKDFRLDPEHPPLIKELSALPLLFFKNIKINFDNKWDLAGKYYYDSWWEARSISEDFLYKWGNNPEKLIFYGRVVPMLLTLLLGYFAYFWAKKLYGEKAGVFAAFLTLFCPIILAHGRLINTDIGITLFLFISVYFWGKYLKSPNWINLLILGFFIGLTFASKYTAVILLPILVFLMIAKIFTDTNKSLWWKYVLGFFGSGIIAFLVVWASYGFALQVPPATLSNELIAWINQSRYSEVFNNTIIKFRPLLFPAEYFKGLVLVLRHSIAGHQSFLLGQSSDFGWWYYFPVAMFFKSSIALFAFIGFTVKYYKEIRAKVLFDELLIIIPPIIFLFMSMLSNANLGVRHILPIYPFLFVFVSKSINAINFHKLSAKTVIFFIAVVWYFIIALLAFPNYIAYFNEFAGGSKNNYKILADSNLDWGQDMYRIREFINTNLQDQNEKIYIVYPWNGDSALNYYGLNYPFLESENRNIKGRVIISATYYNTYEYSWLRDYPKTYITPGVFMVEVK